MTSSSGATWRRKAALVALWTITVLESVMMGLAGYSKFGSPEGWMSMFEGWGYPGWFALVIGGGELALALTMLVPRFASYAAAGLIVIMIGALGTVLMHPEGQMGPAPPAINLVVLSIILVGRWKARWRRPT